MNLELVARQRLEQRMHLSQQMLQNLELLVLPAIELREFIQKELEENPALEEVDAPDEISPGPETDESPEAEAREEMLARVEDQWYESERRTRRCESAEAAERRLEMLNNSPGPADTLKDHLSNQLLLLDLPEETKAFCTHVIEHLPDSGILKASVEDMVTSLPEELLQGPLEILAEKLRSAIKIIQSLEPRGVGAQSIKECLLLQLDPADVLYPVLRKFIGTYLEDAAANRLPHVVRSILADPGLLKDLGREGDPDPGALLEDVKQLISEVAKLNPSPGGKFSTDKPSRVHPEVLIRRVDGRLEIVLEDGWLPAIGVNRTYEDLVRARSLSSRERAIARRMAQDARFTAEARQALSKLATGKRVLAIDRARCAEIVRNHALSPEESELLADLAAEPASSKTDREFIKRKVTAGRKLIAAIEQRRGTIYRITEQILRRQAAFFEDGIEHLRPLKMQEIADALGIHLSTVSRAVSEKWMETPQGILPFKFFFASAAHGADGGSPDGGTRLALLGKVRDILETEDKAHPHSDLEIARILTQDYRIPAARRTVAKYREELRFPPANRRKCY